MLPVPSPAFPTPLHADAAAAAVDFFHAREPVDTVLLVNSCARGLATPESDIDMAILLRETATECEARDLESEWRSYAGMNAVVKAFTGHSAFSAMHIDVITGRIEPQEWDDGGGPDYFEVEIGNQVAYSAPLTSPGSHYRQLRSRWLPYYSDELQRHRLGMVCAGCLYDLEHVPFFVKRSLHYQAFDRLYKAFQEFLQGLFIARHTYPVAYNKWLRNQVVDWLELPQVYGAFRSILSIRDIESDDLIASSRRLTELADTWLAHN